MVWRLFYLEDFWQQWKEWLYQEFADIGLAYNEALDASDEHSIIQFNSLMYLKCRREASSWLTSADASRDQMAWKMLERQLKALAGKAERGVFNLSTKLYVDEQQIVIRLNFRYDPEQHIIYVS